LPNFNLKNIISTYTMDFSWKNGPNPPGLEKKLKIKSSKSPDFYDKFQ
jgi:hypothetical protein